MNTFNVMTWNWRPHRQTVERSIIPHSAVFRPGATTTKTRIVFDCSAKTPSGAILNDCLLIGQKKQPDIPKVLTNFRLHEIGMTADISQMFLQIIMHPDCRNFLRFLWYDKNNDVKEFCFRKVIFGSADSPYQAISTVSIMPNR